MWDCIDLFFLQHLEKLGVNLTPYSLYIEEVCGVKKYRVTECSNLEKSNTEMVGKICPNMKMTPPCTLLPEYN